MLRRTMAFFKIDDDILALVAGDAWMMGALEAVAALGLPDAWIGAGFLRGAVWDRLHGYAERTPPGDIDVIYHDPGNLDRAADEDPERRLAVLLPGVPWSVRNQARMHLKNGDPPYRSSTDALAHWLETPTTVAVRLNQAGGPELLAPLGTEDLLGLVVRPTPHARTNIGWRPTGSVWRARTGRPNGRNCGWFGGDYPRSTPPVALFTWATIFLATASISASVMVFLVGCRVTAMASDFLPSAMPLPA